MIDIPKSYQWKTNYLEQAKQQALDHKLNLRAYLDQLVIEDGSKGQAKDRISALETEIKTLDERIKKIERQLKK